MTFFGKVYYSDKKENLDEYLSATQTPDAIRTALVKTKASQKLDKNADGTYTLTVKFDDVPEYNAVETFQLGVELEVNYGDETGKSTFTLDGNTLTQVLKFKDSTITMTREFSDSALKQSLKSTAWNGEAYIYYKA